MPALTNSYGLAHWFDACDQRDGFPAKVVVIGGGLVEGAVSDTPTYLHRWPYLLQELLREAMPASGVVAPGIGYVPARYTSPLLTQDVTTVAGTPDLVTQKWGLGLKAVTLSDPDEISWPSISCERVRVWYGKGNETIGTGVVKIDGTPASGSISSMDSGNSDGYTWSSASLGAVAPHTVGIVGESAAPDYFIAEGVEFFNSEKDSTSGIKIYDSALSGADSATFAQNLTPFLWSVLGPLAPQLVVVMLAINDWGVITPTQYVANVEEFLVNLESHLDPATHSVLLVTPYRPVKDGASNADWTEMMLLLQELAVGNITHYDLQQDWPTLTAGQGYESGLMYEDDFPQHPNQAGQLAMAEALATVLTPSLTNNAQHGTKVMCMTVGDGNTTGDDISVSVRGVDPASTGLGYFPVPEAGAVSAMCSVASRGVTYWAMGRSYFYEWNEIGEDYTALDTFDTEPIEVGIEHDWQQILFREVAPPGATHWLPKVHVYQYDPRIGDLAPPPSGTTLYVDSFYVTDNARPVVDQPYLDGDQPGAAWEGEPHNATSILGDVQSPA